MVDEQPGNVVQNDEPIDLDLGKPPEEGERPHGLVEEREWRTMKETGARWIAQGLIVTFAGTIFLVLLWGFGIIIVSGSSGEAEKFTKTLLPFLDGVAKFAAQVFSPLLAFVLGYYFGERKTQ